MLRAWRGRQKNRVVNTNNVHTQRCGNGAEVATNNIHTQRCGMRGATTEKHIFQRRHTKKCVQMRRVHEQNRWRAAQEQTNVQPPRMWQDVQLEKGRHQEGDSNLSAPTVEYARH